MKKTKIQWCDHTFNPWIGCTKISPGCVYCYAEAIDRRFKTGGTTHWGEAVDRHRTSKSYWEQPIRWNKEAAQKDEPTYVFCGSMCDVFDNHHSIQWAWRRDLWHLILRTQELTWLLLTKRPANLVEEIDDMLEWGDFDHRFPNVWFGISAENEPILFKRSRDLSMIDSTRPMFVSIEPLLGPIDMNLVPDDLFSWVIVGGESGPNARPMKAEWVRPIRDWCIEKNVPFFFKQWGEYNEDGQRVGRKQAGHLLDGVEWRQMPKGETK
jgi:protein gp37